MTLEYKPWVGKATKIDDYDISRVAYSLGVGEDELHAVLDVETRGTGFDKHGVIKLFEEHVFYRNLPIDQRQKAVALGLANKRWRRNYKNNHETFLKAYEFHPEAALKACSWGYGQILGENYAMVGYDTPEDMVRSFAEDESNQLEAIAKFIKAAGLDDELRERNWRAFARGYNGPGYAKNDYHKKLARRFEWWQKQPDTKWSPGMETVPEADKGEYGITYEAKQPSFTIADLLIKLIRFLRGK